MKKLMFCCFVVSMLALPMWAFAQTVYSIDSISDVKGYGDQSYSFNIGAFDVTSNTTTDTIATNHEWSIYGNQVGGIAPCTGAGCGMVQSVGYDLNQDIISNNVTKLVGPNIAGGAEMNTMGGLAACIKANPAETIIPTFGSLVQTQTVSNAYTVSVYTPSGNGSAVGPASYTGTQTLNLQVGPIP